VLFHAYASRLLSLYCSSTNTAARRYEEFRLDVERARGSDDGEASLLKQLSWQQ
jgi:hypothetical protein